MGWPRSFNHFDDGATAGPVARALTEIGAYEMAFIGQQRAKHASWSAIAGMLRVSEDAVRRIGDPDYRPPEWRAKPAAMVPAPAAPKTVSPWCGNGWRIKSGADAAAFRRRLQVLSQLVNGPKDRGQIAAATGLPSAKVGDILRCAKRGRTVLARFHGRRAAHGAPWTLTPAGVAWLAEHGVVADVPTGGCVDPVALTLPGAGPTWLSPDCAGFSKPLGGAA